MRTSTDRRRIAAYALGLGIAVAGLTPRPGDAAPAASAASTVSELVVVATKTVAELTVTAKVKCLAPEPLPVHAQRPSIVSTFPASGAVVRPGLLIVRVTFNQPMACDGGFTSAAPLQNPCPGASREMLLSLDRKTVRAVCIVEANTDYGLWVSQDPTIGSFMGLAGLPSEAHRLSFTTSSGPAVATVCEAMVEDAESARQVRQRRPLDCSSPSGASEP
jgi:hypothetical protein